MAYTVGFMTLEAALLINSLWNIDVNMASKILANTGSGNNFGLSGTKPLCEPMLIYLHLSFRNFTWQPFTRRAHYEIKPSREPMFT